MLVTMIFNPTFIEKLLLTEANIRVIQSHLSNFILHQIYVMPFSALHQKYIRNFINTRKSIIDIVQLITSGTI